jgi:hypothetical protein
MRELGTGDSLRRLYLEWRFATVVRNGVVDAIFFFLLFVFGWQGYIFILSRNRGWMRCLWGVFRDGLMDGSIKPGY